MGNCIMGNCCGNNKPSSTIDISSTNQSAVKKANIIINSGRIESDENRNHANTGSKDPPSSVSETDSNAKVVKVLLLGAAESGKSTLVRQIRIIHEQNFNNEETLRYKHNIRSSCLEFFALLVSEYLPVQNATSEWKTLCNRFLERLTENKILDRDLFDTAISLWHDSIVQEYLVDLDSERKVRAPRKNTFLPSDVGTDGGAKHLRFYLDDPEYHFLPSLERIMSSGYCPTSSDILSLRSPTTGIVETWFKKSNLIIGLIDVGGQRSERKKWLHCFESVSAVLFLVAISEYDQSLSEDRTVNRMKESLKLFASVCNVKWFSKASMLLFLNKRDVFDEKINHSPITSCFESYTGPQDKNEAAAFISQQFALQNHVDREVYRHFTCAKDSQNISVVFNAVTDVITRSALHDVGLI